VGPESAGVMAQINQRTTEKPPSPGRTKRVLKSVARRIRLRIFLPGDSLADGVKRSSAFVLGWGAFIGLLAWGAYRQGVLHGVGDGITFCAVLFLLAVLAAPDYMRPGGPRGRNQY
jgi:hypothetical protein